MPGDKIIREGEKGAEMFFIQEGKVEILVKKPALGQGHIKYKVNREFLEKGGYFGEVDFVSYSILIQLGFSLFKQQNSV